MVFDDEDDSLVGLVNSHHLSHDKNHKNPHGDNFVLERYHEIVFDDPHFYAKFYREMYEFVLHRVGKHHDAEDLVQEAFLKSLRYIKSFDYQSYGLSQNSFNLWLKKILANTIVDYHRHKNCKRISSYLDTSSVDPAACDDFISHIESEDLLQQVMKKIEKMPSNYKREIITGHSIDGFSHSEMTFKLGVCIGTVKSRLHRARSELKKRCRHMVN